VLTFLSFQKITPSTLKYLFYFSLICFFAINQYSCTATRRNEGEVKNNSLKRGYKIVATEKNQIRVLLSEEQKSVSLSLQGLYIFTSDNEAVDKLKKGDKLSFQINSGGITTKFNSRDIDGITFLLQPVDSESVILFSGKRYSGDLLIVYNDNNGILVINRLSMDDYLLGVLPAEMAVKSNQPERFEALKAFAICARTFAEMKKAKGNTYYDITDDVRDQVFSGTGNFTQLDRNAVEATSHQVLKYKEKLAEVFYHSACGGMLEDPANVFSGKADDYLIAKKDGEENPNCEISPSFYWKETYTQFDLLKLLKAKNLLSKKQRVVKDVEISDVFPSGRVKELHISFVDADDVVIHASEIRNFFVRKETKGILRSSLFTLSIEKTKNELKKVTLNGKGSGHGVGLCQWGAMNLSAKGENYHEILDFYFHGCTIGQTE
jgi:stage II sporulation protein D